MRASHGIMVMEVVAMCTRQFIHDPQELLSQGKALVKDNSVIKFAYRVTMVNLLLGGMSARELAIAVMVKQRSCHGSRR